MERPRRARKDAQGSCHEAEPGGACHRGDASGQAAAAGTGRRCARQHVGELPRAAHCGHREVENGGRESEYRAALTAFDRTSMTRLNELSAVDAAKKLATREVSAEQYLKACLERIDEREKDVRAFAFIDREGALA